MAAKNISEEQKEVSDFQNIPSFCLTKAIILHCFSYENAINSQKEACAAFFLVTIPVHGLLEKICYGLPERFDFYFAMLEKLLKVLFGVYNDVV